MWAWKSGGSKILCKCTLWTWVAQRSLDDVFRAGQHAMLSSPLIQALFKNKETILKLNTNTILTSNQLAFHPFSNIDSWKSADLSSTFSLVLFGFLSWMEVTTIMFNLFVQQLWWMTPVNISINRFVAYALQNLTFAWVFYIKRWNFSSFEQLWCRESKQTRRSSSEQSCMCSFILAWSSGDIFHDIPLMFHFLHFFRVLLEDPAFR